MLFRSFPSPGATDGCDFSGTVVGVGIDAAQSNKFRLGDRVFGAVHGSNPIDHQSGSFAEYVVIDAGFLFHTPSNISNETAAGIGGTGLGTLGLALFKSLALRGRPDKPVDNGDFVLCLRRGHIGWDDGTPTSQTVGIQCSKFSSELLINADRSGYRPIATCSPKNFNLVRSYGADNVFDYNAPDVAESIKAYTKNTLNYALDIITEVKTIDRKSVV